MNPAATIKVSNIDEYIALPQQEAFDIEYWLLEEAKLKRMPAEKELGMELSSAGQLIPEQSTAAIIVHHAKAKYYSVGESRVEQLMKG